MGIFSIIFILSIRNNLLLIIINLIVLLISNFVLIEPRMFFSSYLSNVVELDFTSYFLKITMELVIILSIIATFCETLNSKKIYTTFNNHQHKYYHFIFNLLRVSSNILYTFRNFSYSNLPNYYRVRYQPERLSAAYALIFYTVIFSFPLIMVITYLFNINLILDVRRINWLTSSIFLGQEIYVYNVATMFFIGGFMVKLPIYLIHL